MVLQQQAARSLCLQGKAVVDGRAVLLQRLPHRLQPSEDPSAQVHPLLEGQLPQALRKAFGGCLAAGVGCHRLRLLHLAAAAAAAAAGIAAVSLRAQAGTRLQGASLCSQPVSQLA